MLDSMTAYMTQQVKNTKHGGKELVERVGTALLNGLGNLLDITAHEAKEDRSVEDESLIVITNERKEKVSGLKQWLIINNGGTVMRFCVHCCKHALSVSAAFLQLL